MIDYAKAVGGHLKLVPEGEHRSALEQDYRAMIEDGLFLGEIETFDQLMKRCETIQALVNKACGTAPPPSAAAAD